MTLFENNIWESLLNKNELKKLGLINLHLQIKSVIEEYATEFRDNEVNGVLE